jgi:hypothetical protein
MMAEEAWLSTSTYVSNDYEHRRFWLSRPQFRLIVGQTPKGTFLRQNTRFEPSTMKIGSAVRAVREPEKVYK